MHAEGLHDARVRVRQAHEEHVPLATDTADHANRFAEIDLRVPRWMMQGHELLRCPLPRLAHSVRHDRDAAGKAMLIAQTLKNPFGGMALLLWSFAV